jgi:hypothetical protein
MARRKTTTLARGELENNLPPTGENMAKAVSLRKIHPIVMYPFAQPRDTRNLVALYDNLVQRLAANADKYTRPRTVLNRQTYHRNRGSAEFVSFIEKRVLKFSDVVDTWAVDTCQMWLAGFGRAFDEKSTVYDVYWLIPGDFDYASPSGERVLSEFERIPEEVYSGNAELCLGEISVPLNSSKQLIDTYGTYGLLYNWFPAEAQGLRTITDKPRTEFFAISHDYLKKALVSQRWYAYEQTIVILLQGMQGVRPMREIHKVRLGEIVDEPIGRDTLASAMQQVERTERVLKLYWRELKERQDPMWPDKFRLLDHQSEQIRSAAMVILQQILA